jgi:ArsR family transcriptional regulator, arsenate/arsenite/antimonite-responsive transcriptional repressor
MLNITYLLKLLSDTNRLRILQLLNKRKLCVCELAYVLGVTQPSISRHLKKMREMGLVGQEQAGFWTNYYLKPLNPGDLSILNAVLDRLKGVAVFKEDLVRLSKADRKKLCCR